MTIKQRMKDGYERIAVALSGCDISERKRKAILSEYTAVCYQWAYSNATACVLECCFRDAAPEAYEEAVRGGMHETFARAHDMAPTPDEWDEDSGIQEAQ